MPPSAGRAGPPVIGTPCLVRRTSAFLYFFFSGTGHAMFLFLRRAALPVVHIPRYSPGTTTQNKSDVFSAGKCPKSPPADSSSDDSNLSRSRLKSGLHNRIMSKAPVDGKRFFGFLNLGLPKPHTQLLEAPPQTLVFGQPGTRPSRPVLPLSSQFSSHSSAHCFSLSSARYQPTDGHQEGK